MQYKNRAKMSKRNTYQNTCHVTHTHAKLENTQTFNNCHSILRRVHEKREREKKIHESDAKR